VFVQFFCFGAFFIVQIGFFVFVVYDLFVQKVFWYLVVRVVVVVVVVAAAAAAAATAAAAAAA